MSSQFLDRLEHELVEGMRRHERHPLGSRLRLRLRRPRRFAASLALVAIAAVAIAVVARAPQPIERSSRVRPTDRPAPPHVAGRNWKPAAGSLSSVFELYLTSTRWRVNYQSGQQNLRGGELRWSGERFTAAADPPCAAPGTYRVIADERRLRIVAEHDPCVQRRDLLHGRWLSSP